MTQTQHNVAKAIHNAADLEHGLGQTAMNNTFFDLAEDIADALGVDRVKFIKECDIE